MKKDMIQGFTPHAGGLDEYAQVFQDGRLPGKLFETGWPDAVFIVRFHPACLGFLRVKVWICHIVNVTRLAGMENFFMAQKNPGLAGVL
jgi:hypothetical protein